MNDTVVIGQVALIQRGKRQDFTLQVIHELKNRGLDTVGIFCGECRDNVYYDELKQKVDTLGLQGTVLFMGRRNDVSNILQILDVLIIPSSFEGFPLAGMEAASAGVPVVACNVAGAKEFVEVSKAGGLFEENDTNSAADAIVSILRDMKKYQVNGQVFAAKQTLQSYKTKIADVFCG